MATSRLRHLAAATLVAGAVLAAAAAPAGASTVELVELSVYLRCDIHPNLCNPEPPPETALVYRGGGEANRVTLTPAGNQVRISDPASRIVPGAGCSRVDDHNVSCALPRALVYVGTSAGSDRVRSRLGPAGRLTVDGGAGNDVLAGGSGADALLGGGGADRLSGGDGNDRLFDASSSDPLRAGQQAPSSGGSDVFFGAVLSAGRTRDSFDGGRGVDAISYEGRRGGVRIDLASTRRISGARREGDSIRLVENATGGLGSDRIAGSARANRLIGDGGMPSMFPGGDDRIAGRAGADSIEAGSGRNVLSGGSGNDNFTLGRSGREHVTCGSGRDSVASPLPGDFLQADCERPILTGLIDGVLAPPALRSRLPLRRGRPPTVLSGRLGCFLDNACEARLEVRVRGRGTRRGTSPRRGTLLAAEPVSIGVRETKSFELRLSTRGLRLVRRHRALRVRVVVSTPRLGTNGPGYVTVLRAP